MAAGRRARAVEMQIGIICRCANHQTHWYAGGGEAQRELQVSTNQKAANHLCLVRSLRGPSTHVYTRGNGYIASNECLLIAVAAMRACDRYATCIINDSVRLQGSTRHLIHTAAQISNSDSRWVLQKLVVALFSH